MKYEKRKGTVSLEPRRRITKPYSKRRAGFAVYITRWMCHKQGTSAAKRGWASPSKQNKAERKRSSYCLAGTGNKETAEKEKHYAVEAIKTYHNKSNQNKAK